MHSSGAQPPENQFPLVPYEDSGLIFSTRLPDESDAVVTRPHSEEGHSQTSWYLDLGWQYLTLQQGHPETSQREYPEELSYFTNLLEYPCILLFH